MQWLFIRIGVISFFVGLVGMIAYAQVQRNHNDNLEEEMLASPSPLRDAAPSDSSSGANPLRPEPSAKRPEPPAPLEIPDANVLYRDPDTQPSKGKPAAPSAGDKSPLKDPFSGPGRATPIPDHNREAPQNGVKLTGAEAPAKGGPFFDPRGTEPTPPLSAETETKRQPAPLIAGPMMPPPAKEPEKTPGSAKNDEPKRFPSDPFAQPMASPPPAHEAGLSDPRPQTDPLGKQPEYQPAHDSTPFGARDKGSFNAPPSKEGIGQPGAKQLEGPQSPQVTIQKFMPPEIQVGKPAVFKITVQNTGQVPATQVEIHDMVPRGTQLTNTRPRASENAQGELVWSLGTLQPGQAATVEMELMPTGEGEIGSVASLRFGAEASAKTVSTKPQLVVEMAGPNKVLIGESVPLTITVSNPGSGVATGVMLEDRLPPGLQHPSGSELEYPIGNLRPGESKKITLRLTAAAAGPITNVLSARADGSLRAENRLDFEVVAPKLDLVMEGPKRRYLEREATYQLSVVNPGTAPAEQVQLVAYLPPGLKFVSANNAGQYVEADRAVYWRLEELPSNQTGTVQLVTMPVEAGPQNIMLRGTAQKGLNVQKEQPVVVEGIAAILFQVADLADPIEVGGETTYEVRIVNQGSKAANNVQLVAILPPELQPLTAEGPTRYAIQSSPEGSKVFFEGLGRLSPKTDATYRIRAKGLRQGDLRVRFELATDDMKTPVVKEESTRVYADE
jgi:uncharacterized repeat protein (TIGR01451 family)